MLLLVALVSQAPIDLRTGLVITRSGLARPGVYRCESIDNSGKTASITLRGDNITFDFAGAEMRARNLTIAPDQRKGVALIIEGKNVTIKNLKAHAFKFGVIARNAPGLKILNCDFSYNWKQKLGSTLDREDSGDWMSFHQNEKDEWMRFGAGIYLRDCDNFEVKGTKITNGQCGLMITNCNNGLVWNNDFSFLSAIGLGMYRSSGNRVMHNNIDWCLRGYSHGKWNRGQDSAGILIYEQSNKNVFAYNSVTHSGDGFFLWAGQSTMETGQGGCNDNLLYGNDWSHAPTNGIEATFSRNRFANNLIMECWHGIWGGYSYDSQVVGNIFAYNAESIAWEHGQNNLVGFNKFHRETTGIKIWQNKSQDPNWGYPKNRDTKSRDWGITRNQFSEISGSAIDIRATQNVAVANNVFDAVTNLFTANGPVTAQLEPMSIGNRTNPQTELKLEEGQAAKYEGARGQPSVMQPSGNVIQGYKVSEYTSRFATNWNPLKTPRSAAIKVGGRSLGVFHPSTFAGAPAPIKGGNDPYIKGPRGRRYMLVDEWGPYDFKRPVMWPRSEAQNGEQTFELLGPLGLAKVVASRGLKIVAFSGNGETWRTDVPLKMPVPSWVKVRYEDGQGQDVFVKLAYTGGQVTSDGGVVTPAGKPTFFSWSKFHLPIDWTVRFWSYDAKTQDPREDYAKFDAARKGPPLATLQVSDLNFAWAGAPAPGVPADHFTTIAEGTFEVKPGRYKLRYTTDDGYRLFVNGLIVKEDWSWHAPKTEEVMVNFQGGKHTLKFDHFELDGFSTLKFEVIPVR